jgi:hypothetical protein
MEFDPRRAARVGAKMLRQRQDRRFAKRRIMEEMEDEVVMFDKDIDDSDSELRETTIDIDVKKNRKGGCWRNL